MDGCRDSCREGRWREGKVEVEGRGGEGKCRLYRKGREELGWRVASREVERR